MPDGELAVIQALRADAAVTTLVDTRIYTEVPANPAWPLVVVRRIGGAPSPRHPLHRDTATVQVDAYADTKQAARQLVATCQTAMHAAAGSTVDEAHIGHVASLSLRWLPDDPTDRPRYVLDMRVDTHPR